MSDLKPPTLRELWGTVPDLRERVEAANADEAAAPSEPVAWAIKCIDTAPPIYEVMVGEFCYITFRDEATAEAYRGNIFDADKFTVVPLYTRPAPREGVTPEMVEMAIRGAHTEAANEGVSYWSAIARRLTAALAVSP